MSNNYFYKQKKVRKHDRHTPKTKKVITIGAYDRKQRYRNYAKISQARAQQLFDKRSQRAKTLDLKTTSKKVLQEPNEYWAENTGRSDTLGIDTKKEKEIKYSKGKLKFYLKGFSAGKEWIKDLSKENVLELKQLSKYEKYSNEWTKEDQKQAVRLYNEYLSTINYEWVTKVSEGDLKKHIGATDQAIYLLKGSIEKENKYLKEGYDLTKETLGEKIAEKIKKEALDTIKKAKEKLKEKKKDLQIFNKELEQRIKKTKKVSPTDTKEIETLKRKPKPKILAKVEKPTKRPKKPLLPKLSEDKKYILVYVNKDGYAKYIGHTTNPEKAIKDLNAERKISKKLGIKSKIELFVANDIYDVRDQIHARGREDYLITGDTYSNRKKIHGIARVKFDYEQKGFRGKLSKAEIEDLKKIPGLEIEKSKAITKEDIGASNIAKAHSKSRKYLKHEKQKGSIWQKDNPFTKEQQWTWNSLTHFPRDWNKDFKESVNKKEKTILKQLNIQKIEDAPEDVQNAFDYYCKNTYENIRERNRARQIAPPMYVVGPAKYPTHKIPKAEAIEKRASEKLKKAEKTLKKITYQYTELKPRKTTEEIRQEYRDKITSKLNIAKKEGKKVFSPLQREWYPIERVNKKTITVKSKTENYTFTIDKAFITQIEGV